MEEDSIPQQFSRLEERVGQLVQTCRELQNSKAELEARLRDFEEKLRTKDAAADRYMEEKTLIQSKIDNLLSRLDEALDVD